MDKNNSVHQLFIGALVGAAAGLLLAPKKGLETREELKAKANNAAEKVKTKVNSTTSEIDSLKSKLEEKVKELSNKVAKDAKSKGDEEKDKISKIIADLQDYIDNKEKEAEEKNNEVNAA